MRHGYIQLYAIFLSVTEPRRIFQITFGVVRGPIYCSYVNNQAPPNFGVDGEYTCYPLEADQSVPVFSSGTLNLEPRGAPKRPPLFNG